MNELTIAEMTLYLCSMSFLLGAVISGTLLYSVGKRHGQQEITEIFVRDDPDYETRLGHQESICE